MCVGTVGLRHEFTKSVSAQSTKASAHKATKLNPVLAFGAHLSMYGLFSCLIEQAGIVISLSSLFPLFTLPYTPATIVTSITISFLNHILAALALAIDPLFPRHIYMS